MIKFQYVYLPCKCHVKIIVYTVHATRYAYVYKYVVYRVIFW